MVPNFLRYNITYKRVRYFIFFCNRSLCNISNRILFSNIYNNFFGKFCKNTLCSFSAYATSIFIRMNNILFMGNVFKIINVIIGFITIFMVNRIIFWPISNKMFGNERMDRKRFHYSIFSKSGSNISSWTYRIFQYFSNKSIMFWLISSNITKIRNAIPTFVSLNVFPNFVHTSSKIKRVLFSGESEMVKFLHLLRTQILQMEKPLLIRRYIVS